MIGQLKYRARLERMSKTDNGRGGWTETPVFLEEIWVAQYRLTTRQVLQYRQYGQDVENKFLARYNENIKQHDTLVVNGKRYRILYLETPIDPTDFMEIYTEGERL